MATRAPRKKAARAAPDPQGAAASAAGAARFVTLRVGNSVLAVPLADVREIVRRPEIVRIPLSPPSLEGLARRHGVVLPVIGLRSVLGLPGAAVDKDARVVVVGHRGQPVGLAVDRVEGIVSVAGARIDRDAGDAGVDAALLAGVIRDPKGGAVAAILDAGPLVERQFADLVRPAAERAAAHDGVAAVAAQAKAAATVGLVTFAVAGQEFALPISDVERIVPHPAEVTRMPKARAHLLGVMALGDGLLPLVGLRELFGLGGSTAEQGRVVVARLGDGAQVGLAVDGVREILRVDPALVAPVPAILAREAEFEDIQSIVRLQGGKRLVSVLSAERMLAHAADVAAALEEHSGGEATMAERGAGGSDEPFVVFRLGEAEYGLPVSAVQEIQRRPKTLSPLPKAPEFVAGLVNLRGAALPVVDLRRILRLGEAVRDERQRVVVLAVREFRAGLIVDSTSGVLRIPADSIEPAPTVTEAQRQLIGRVATLDGQKRMVLLLEVEALFDMEHLAALLETA
ncbi:chemotaxis protein CheW [Azospirillum sp.]|uniref:chemotaxis protein CheW n=1 Tax=Azospirillum sp. TaxID=34012 RepID=UPI003D71BAD1